MDDYELPPKLSEEADAAIANLPPSVQREIRKQIVDLIKYIQRVETERSSFQTRCQGLSQRLLDERWSNQESERQSKNDYTKLERKFNDATKELQDQYRDIEELNCKLEEKEEEIKIIRAELRKEQRRSTNQDLQITRLEKGNAKLLSLVEETKRKITTNVQQPQPNTVTERHYLISSPKNDKEPSYPSLPSDPPLHREVVQIQESQNKISNLRYQLQNTKDQLSTTIDDLNIKIHNLTTKNTALQRSYQRLETQAQKSMDFSIKSQQRESEGVRARTEDWIRQLQQREHSHMSSLIEQWQHSKPGM